MTEEAMKALLRARDKAMHYTLAARIPECGEFGAIAQDLDCAIDVIAAAMAADKADLREGVSFLLDRLDDFANDIQAEHEAREYHGHVAPAVARLRQALETPHVD